MPRDLSATRHVADFTRFNLIEPDISRNRLYVATVEEIAEYIAALCALPALTSRCDAFDIPAAPHTPTPEPLEFPRARET